MSEVSYEHAMVTLTEMFRGIDPAIIEMVLRSRRGHMESTVDELLGMNAEEAHAREQLRRSKEQASRPPRPLPDDFLRWDEDVSPEELARRKQIADDALLARALLDEDFVNHLRQDQTFQRTLEQDQLPRPTNPAPEKVYVEKEPEPSYVDSFKNQLMNMGEASRQMFFDLRDRYFSASSEVRPVPLTRREDIDANEDDDATESSSLMATTSQSTSRSTTDSGLRHRNRGEDVEMDEMGPSGRRY